MQPEARNTLKKYTIFFAARELRGQHSQVIQKKPNKNLQNVANKDRGIARVSNHNVK